MEIDKGLITKRLVNWLTKNGLTGGIIERETGIRTSSVSDWKKGKTIPTAPALIKLNSAYNLPIEFILTGKGTTEDENNIILKYRELDEPNKKRLTIEITRLYELQNIE